MPHRKQFSRAVIWSLKWPCPKGQSDGTAGGVCFASSRPWLDSQHSMWSPQSHQEKFLSTQPGVRPECGPRNNKKKSHQNQNLVPAVYDIIDSLSWWNILCFPLFQLRVPLGLFNGCIAVKEELEKTDGLLFIFLFVLVKCYSWLSTQMLLPAVLGRPCGVGSQIQA